MIWKNSASLDLEPARRYRSPDIPLAVIRRYARQIAERFRPEKIILFGSYAYGTPHQDSDVDLLVVMPCANHTSQAVRIRLALHAPFPMDLLVRTPEKLQRRLELGDWFLREIVAKGKVLYEAHNGRVGTKSRIRSGRRRTTRRRKRRHHDETCFHCQQSAEKYLKALLQELGLAIPRTHDLDDLLDLLVSHDATLRRLRRGMSFLSQFAVDYRYPGENATRRQAEAAVRWAERVRAELRSRLGLKS